MNLREKLYQFCDDNSLHDLSCIVHFALLNYISIHPSHKEWVNISPEVLDSFIGIGKDKITALLDSLCECDEVEKDYRFYCHEQQEEFCDSYIESEVNEKIDKDGNIDVYCTICSTEHTYNIFEKSYLIRVGYEGNRSKIIDALEIRNQDVINEIVIMNTNPDNVDKLAEIILSRLTVDTDKKEEAKSSIVKMLSSVKDISGLIAGISEDGATTVRSIRNIAEDFSGIGTLKDILKA